MKTYYYETTVPMHPSPEGGVAPEGNLINYVKAEVPDDTVPQLQVEQGLIYECYALAISGGMVIDGVVTLRPLTEEEFVQSMRMADAMQGSHVLQ